MKYTNKLMENCSGWVKGLFIVSLLCAVFAAPGSLAADSEASGTTAAEQVATVSINSADAETLAEMLDGVGQSKAQAIVDWREENGSFQSVDQLTEVKGIGSATLDKNRHKLSL